MITGFSESVWMVNCAIFMAAGYLLGRCVDTMKEVRDLKSASRLQEVVYGKTYVFQPSLPDDWWTKPILSLTLRDGCTLDVSQITTNIRFDGVKP